MLNGGDGNYSDSDDNAGDYNGGDGDGGDSDGGASRVVHSWPNRESEVALGRVVQGETEWHVRLDARHAQQLSAFLPARQRRLR